MTEHVCIGEYPLLNATDKLAVAISQALAAFITYENRRHQRINIFESFLYKPIIDIAGARGWDISHEYKIKSNCNKLQGREIDFVLKKNAHVCSLEIKYYRSLSSAKTSLSKILTDVEKLKYFDRTRMKDVAAVGGYLVVVGKRDLLKGAFALQPREADRRRLFETARFLLNEGTPDIFYECGWRTDEIGADLAKNAVLTLRIKNEIYRQ